ncbi:hypothetical protein BCR33DRAFT_722793 [Rhizoclosmatium globosum]|uniref:Uncharacterized protein n=1 Tax=Rhizoclosmatium globosum TaxID=329046 RepID=A0A1Y2BI20_9FUNG|nr:hypothetical protein BCR33DRAFT_722793 [Rhizoclosmatium globosum]|eukprot:ORY34406.1 hypothetical protein BCR33DRAFT_722793 [Rhizoclosmatium globosum]
MQIRRTHNRDLNIVSQLTGCCNGHSGLNLKTSRMHHTYQPHQKPPNSADSNGCYPSVLRKQGTRKLR